MRSLKYFLFLFLFSCSSNKYSTTNKSYKKQVKAFAGIRLKAELKLDQLDAAVSLQDLNLPGNRLEALKGTRKGQYSIRINQQWCVCFEWPDDHDKPFNTEITDYH